MILSYPRASHFTQASLSTYVSALGTEIEEYRNIASRDHGSSRWDDQRDDSLSGWISGVCSSTWRQEGSDCLVWRGEEQVGSREEGREMVLAAYIVPRGVITTYH